MFEWSEELLMVRDAVRDVRRQRDPAAPRGARARRPAAVRPAAQALQDVRHGRDGAPTASTSASREEPKRADAAASGERRERAAAAAGSRCCRSSSSASARPGMVTAMGVSVGLTAAAIMAKGTIAQKERWALDLLTLEKIGAWAITEPGSGSDAFGVDEVDRAARRRRVRAQRLEDVHHQRPVRRHDRVHLQARRGQPARASARSLQFVLDTGMPGLEQSKPLRKMGLHSSPTGDAVPRRRARRHAIACSARARRRSAAAGREASKATFVDRALRRRGDGARHRRALPRAVRRVREGRACSSAARSASSSSSS